jgi:hypothetical protein
MATCSWLTSKWSVVSINQPAGMNFPTAGAAAANLTFKIRVRVAADCFRVDPSRPQRLGFDLEFTPVSVGNDSTGYGTAPR